MFQKDVVFCNQLAPFSSFFLKSLVLLLTLGSALTHAQSSYQLTELTGLGGQRSSAAGINSFGDIVGWSQQSNGERQAVKWSISSSSAQVIPGLYSIAQSQAKDINDNGVIIGSYYDYNSTVDWSTGPKGWYEGFVLDSNGSVRNTTFSQIEINNDGETVGTGGGFTAAKMDADGNYVRELCGTDDSGQPLTSNCDTAYGNGINNNGDIVGDTSIRPIVNGYQYSRGYLWDDAGNFQLLEDLFAGLTSSSANSINDQGEIVGSSYDPSSNRTTATLWIHGVPVDLGSTSVNSYAIAINNQGFIVGGSSTDSTDRAGTLWDNNGNIYDINELLVGYDGEKHIESLNDINDSGYILATLVDENGNRTAALLSPVPIPGAVWLFGSALIGMVGVKRRKNEI